MKVLLYFEKIENIKHSGVGRALKLQQLALTSAGIEWTTNIEDDFDILHINTVFFNSDKILRLARKKNKSIVYHAHSTMEDFKNSFIFSNVLAPVFKRRIIRLYSSADVIVTPTEYSKGILERYGITKPIYNISNGTEIDRFQKKAGQRQMLLNYFKLQPTDKIILSAGLWIKRKGILDFIEIAKQLPQYKFIWIGATSKLLTPSSILNAIKNSPSNVFFPGYIDNKELFESAFMSADLFFFPSYEENEGLVILEALSCKQKIVARDIGAYKSWLVNNYNCLLGTKNEEFINLIETALNSELKEMRENAYATAAKKDIKNIGLELKNLYANVLENSKNQYLIKN